MAVDRIAKVLVAVHQDAGKRFLEVLQRRGIVHIVKTEEVEAGKDIVELDRQFGRLSGAIDFLGVRAEKRGGFLSGDRIEMPRSEFDNLVTEYEPSGYLDRIQGLSRELEESNNRKRATEAEMARLSPWLSLRHAPSELYGMASTVVLGMFADEDEFARGVDLLEEKSAGVERVADTDRGIASLVMSSKDAAEEVSRILSTLRFEIVDLKNVQKRPAELVQSLAKDMRQLSQRQEQIEAELKQLTAELPKLKAVADNLVNVRERATTEACLGKTQAVLLITGWVRERDYGKLEKLVEETGAAGLSRIQPDEGEEPPVALVNPKPFRPFELVLDLYSLPAHNEVDPTVLLAPFFAISFGFCLTDAGYGIALVLIVLGLMRKFGKDNKLLGMILVGGIFTIVAGALSGGWFGDMPNRLGLAPILTVKHRLMLFDPLKNPMPFFVLALGFGYFHMMYGMVIEIVDCLRLHRTGDALLGQLPWFVGLNALVALVLFKKSLPVSGSAILLALVLASVSSIIVFTRRSKETALPQGLWFGLLWLVLVFFAARLGWLPEVFLYAKWAVIAVFLGMYGYTFADIRKTGRKLQIGFGLIGLVCLGLYFAGMLPALIAGIIGVGFFFTAPVNRVLAKRFIWGGYALYGATSYIGVVLSYIRIMALGMVTAGIAMAVNTIAWMVMGIPVLGVVLAIIVLAIGHTYNIAVNVLGAFVHTLRLNYVEFFPRFYTGGGEPFAPFREENRFVTVR
ncbi:hypothetical protein CH330_06810 [candidate division WOR-3 bacterium JGI_Cruoil_03_51_56]|uniref:Uncharacterized protein n=1 Tax=candidate division WOR-3 bacterium JGI_Cruoil_03_51_56 TaxID=1973747 RepID=A0A235BTZ2_UNCW3|nr:MAG: hypothetical protein CH330_06810 [candidate division WOR-3 bacterium JGI_Cruoil_03_51_56]